MSMQNTAGSPLVSVIIASYNHERYVERAVSSVLSQDLENIEIIVMDDGSSDGTADEVEKLADPRLRVYRLPENRRFHPRNLALAMAKGRYVAFQNSDDEWVQGKLSAQVEIMEKDSRVVACFTGVEIIGEYGEALKESWADGVFITENRSSARWLRHFFDVGNCLCISSVMVRHRPLKDLGYFRARLIQMGDLDLWIRLAAMGDFHIIDRPLTRMRVIEGQNLSRPAAQVSRRSAIELVELLSRYVESPVREKLFEAFHDVLPEGAQSPALHVVGLAIHAWKFSPSHHLFADKVIAEILDDPRKREELVRVFGSEIIHEFISRRGRFEFSLL